MSTINGENHEYQERRRRYQNSTFQYMTNNAEIRNEGYIDPIKHSNNIRIMSLMQKKQIYINMSKWNDSQSL